LSRIFTHRRSPAREFRGAAEKIIGLQRAISGRQGSRSDTTGVHSLSIAALDLARQAPPCGRARWGKKREGLFSAIQKKSKYILDVGNEFKNSRAATLVKKLNLLKSMKLHLRFAPSTTVIRRASALTLLVAGLGIALFAAQMPTATPKSSVAKLDQDQLARPKWAVGLLGKGDPDSNRIARPGPDKRTADNAAQAEYKQRAYPAKDVPMTLTMNAQTAFNKIKNRKTFGAMDLTPANTKIWQLIGPSTAQYPSVLTFSGVTYNASGRITAMALAGSCTTAKCRLFVAAAGGGVWRTDTALGLNPPPKWLFVSGTFGTNAIGALTVDPTDATGNTVYAGTGEANASGDSEAGVGVYKSINGGTTWVKLNDQATNVTSPGNGTYSGDAFFGRSISSIIVDPTNKNVLYVSTTRGVRGVSSVTGGASSFPPVPRPPFGLWKSNNAGYSFGFLTDLGSPRGVNHVELDPSSNAVVYAAGFDRGVWRSTNGGTTFTQIKLPNSVGTTVNRAEFAVTKQGNGNTRIYVGMGDDGSGTVAEFFRADNAKTATNANFVNLTSDQNVDYCGRFFIGAQCWYDNFVVSPAGHPDIVYIGGSYDYATFTSFSNGRGVLRSTDGGLSWNDMTADSDPNGNAPPPGTCCNPNSFAPNAMHPDQHAFVVSPSNPGLFFDGNDGGLMRSDGTFTHGNFYCDDRLFVSGTITSQFALDLCNQLLSDVPTNLYSLNNGLPTFQFQSVAVDPINHVNLLGGTQDNGTWIGPAQTWGMTIYGDGGQSGFSLATDCFLFNSFTSNFHDVNYNCGDPQQWYIASGNIVASGESAEFYSPIIADPDPADSLTIFEGSQSVWRTQDWAGFPFGCPEFFTFGGTPGCGDFIVLGPGGGGVTPTAGTDLTSTFYGFDRVGGNVSVVARDPNQDFFMWAATSTGRVFIGEDVSDPNGANVVWIRIDNGGAPARFPSSIQVDPNNPLHAWISYSGYNYFTPGTPGHVFEVTLNGFFTWNAIDNGTGPMGDLPVSSVVYDNFTGDLYASTDFGVLRLPFGTTTWLLAGTNFPFAEVAGLTIDVSARTLYAATHGRSIWKLQLQ
jgi:hypothetical protein